MSRMADMDIEFSNAEHGDECPYCKAGTIEQVGDENRCRGECGAVGYARSHDADAGDFVRPMSHAKGDEAIYVPSFAKPIK